jgi:hypothetical protein
MHFQYPLESLARRRAALDQLAFAREAHGMLADSDEVMSQPLSHGLAIFAAHEDALEGTRSILRDLYGDFVQVRQPKVRYMPGMPAHEPIMHVRVSARREHAVVLVAELKRRGARVVEECLRSRVFIVRAEAPLAALLGLPGRLDEMTQGLAQHSIRLVRYAPIQGDPHGTDPPAA